MNKLPILALFLALPASGHGAILFEEDFEAATIGELNPWLDGVKRPWICSFNCDATGTNPGTSTEMPFRGSRSLKEVFTIDHTNYTGFYSGGFFDQDFTFAATDEIWTRFYYRTKAFTYDNAGSGTKDNFLANNSYYPNFWFGHWNEWSDRREMMIGAQVPVEDCGYGPYQACSYTPNMARIPLLDDKWYCIEGHIKMNTPGAADGVIEMFIDDLSGAGSRQTIRYVNRTLRGPNIQNLYPDGSNTGNSKLADFRLVRLYTQAGKGIKYRDLYAAGTTRIGCGGTPVPSDTTAPAAPKNLNIAI